MSFFAQHANLQPKGPAQMQPTPFRLTPSEYAALGAIAAIQAIVFFLIMHMQFAPFYPPNSDQTSYYVDTYQLIESTKATGLSALAAELISPGHASGALFTIQGAIIGLLFGGHRSLIASVNLIYFLAFQIMLFFIVRRITQRPHLAWIALSFLLACGTIFVQPGGIFDYRIDFSALCLYGIWCCLLVGSRCLLGQKRWVILVGAVLVLLRFIVLAYIGVILAALLIYAVVEYRSHDPSRRSLAVRRAKNVVMTGIAIAAASFPSLWFARQAIYNYYVVGHLIGNERNIRAAEMGVTDLISNLTFYPRSIFSTHLGVTSLSLIVGAYLCAILIGALRGKFGFDNLLTSLLVFRAEIFTLFICIFLPLAVLTSDTAKSPVVGGIVLGPTLLLTVLVLAAIWPAPRDEEPGQSTNAAAISKSPWRSEQTIAVAMLALAMILFLSAAGHTRIRMPLRDVTRISAINQEIADYVVSSGAGEETISFDRPVDYLNQGTVRLFAFESDGILPQLKPLFGHGPYGIFATPREEAMKLWTHSDIAVLTDPVKLRDANYPISAKIREYWDDMRNWTINNRVLIYSTEIMGVPHKVYGRPPVVISGIQADNWITSAGMTLTVSAEYLARWPYILLTGNADYAALKGVPHAKAEGTRADGSNIDLPATFTRTGNGYEILVDTRADRPDLASNNGEVNIRLSFDRHFVPGPADRRELVIFAPLQRRMIAAPPTSAARK